MAISLPPVEMIHSVWVVSDALAEDGRLMGIVAGHEHLAVMEHKVGIEQISGCRLGSGCGFGPGY